MYLIIIFWQSDGLSYNDIITTNSSTRRYEAIVVKFIISCIPHTWKGKPYACLFNGGNFLKKLWRFVGVLQDTLVLSTELIM